MKCFILILAVSMVAYADGVSLYTENQGVRTYGAEVNLSKLYENELEQLTASVPASIADDAVPLFVAMNFEKRNQSVIASVVQYKPVPTTFRSTRVDVDRLLLELSVHPVAGNNPTKHYEESRRVGFCFGRALFVQKQLTRLGVPAENIRKVFVLGELTNGIGRGVRWDYHVATMFIAPDGQKFMIDVLFNRVYEFRVWAEKMKIYALNPHDPIFRFYIAESTKFQARPGHFEKSDFLNPLYRDFFLDLLIWI